MAIPATTKASIKAKGIKANAAKMSTGTIHRGTWTDRTSIRIMDKTSGKLWVFSYRAPQFSTNLFVTLSRFYQKAYIPSKGPGLTKSPLVLKYFKPFCGVRAWAGNSEPQNKKRVLITNRG